MGTTAPGPGGATGPARATRAQERSHDLGGGRAASEAWTFEFASADAALAGSVHYVRHPDAGRAWYSAVVVGEHRPVVAVVDRSVPFRSSLMEIRTHGLWADHVLEEPHEHWTVGLEAFGVEVDDPLDLLGAARGALVPLGFDLEWEADGGLVGPTGPGGYQLPCRVTGEVLLGDDAVDLDAVGWRDHHWGDIDWRSPGPPRLRAVTEGEHWWLAELTAAEPMVWWASGGEAGSSAVEARVHRGRAGTVAAAHLGWGSGHIEVESLGLAPVPLEADTWSARTLVRVRDTDGGVGVGWMEEQLVGPRRR